MRTAEAADLLLQLVDAAVALHRLAGQLAVAVHQRLDGDLQLRLGEAAHLG
jgi:hypothetical protein